MNILYISSLYRPFEVGGAEQSLRTIAETLASQNHTVHVATLAPNVHDYEANESLDGVQVHRIPLANLYWPWQPSSTRSSLAKATWHTIDTKNYIMVKRLLKLIKSIAPDIVITTNLQGWSTGVVPAIANLGVPVVHIVNDYSLLCPQTTLFRQGRSCGTKNKRCSGCKVLTAPRRNHMNSLSGVIGVSHSVLDFHRDHGLFLNTPETVIYNPLKTGLAPTPSTKAMANDTFTFGFMGRIEKQKGIETLLEAAKILTQQEISFCVKVAGKPNCQSYLKEIQLRYPLASVDYVGYVNSREFLRSLDCLIFPTDWLDALGNSVFEAFSQGVPVIGSDAGGVPETIDEGINGLLFQRGDHRSLSRLMLRILKSPVLYNSLSAQALKKSMQYAPTVRADEHLNFYTEVLLQNKHFDIVKRVVKQRG